MNAPETQTTESPSTGTPAAPAKAPRKAPAKAAAKRTGKPAKQAAKPSKKSSAKLVSKPTDGTPLKTLLAKLKLPADGRAARRKLRAAKFEWHDPKSRWNLSAKQLKQAEAILTGEE